MAQKTKVMPCTCTAVQVGRVKLGRCNYNEKPQFAFPWNTKEKGAKEQDERFGKGMRLHNARFQNGSNKKPGQEGKIIGWTCTVCGERKVN